MHRLSTNQKGRFKFALRADKLAHNIHHLLAQLSGRGHDNIERGNLHLDQTRFLVLDETDRMLDMGFSIQIDKIVRHMPKERQTLMFSATMPRNILQMADKYLSKPERIAVGGNNNAAQNIDQKIIRLDQEKKFGTLCEELEERKGSVIIFVKTKRNADRLAKKLSGGAFDAQAIHGDLKQNKRDRVIQAYRNQKFRILVGTDVVARGLDVPHVAHVINYDLPQMPEDYIHRIGRTGRAGAKGSSLCLISPQDGRKWHAIEQLLDPDSKSTNGAFGDNFGAGGKHKSKKNFKKKPHRGSGKSWGDKKRFSGDKDGEKSWGEKRKFGGEKRRGEGKPFKKRNDDYNKGGEQGEAPRESLRTAADFSDRKKPSHKKSTQRSRDYSDNRQSDNRQSDNRNSDSRGAENRNSKNRNSDSRRSEGRDFEGKKFSSEGKKFSGKKFSGKKFDGQKSEGRDAGKRKFSAGKPSSKPSHGNDGSQPRRFKNTNKRSGGQRAA